VLLVCQGSILLVAGSSITSPVTVSATYGCVVWITCVWRQTPSVSVSVNTSTLVGEHTQGRTASISALLQPPSYPSYLTTSPASMTSLPPLSAMEDCINTARIVSASSSPGIPKHDLGNYLCISSLLSLAKLHLPSSRPPLATLLPKLLDDVPSLNDVTASTLSYGGLY
jgi:hypothetical protein